MNEPISTGIQEKPAMSDSPQGGEGQRRERAKETLREARQNVKARASHAAGQARERGEAYLSEKKARTADRIEGYSEALDETAQRFEEENDPKLWLRKRNPPRLTPPKSKASNLSGYPVPREARKIPKSRPNTERAA